MNMQTLNNVIEINNCKHYLINKGGSSKLYFFDSQSLTERDFDTNHPFGEVYKPKGVIDTRISFVKQTGDNSAFIFKRTEWNVEGNPFLFKKITDDFYILKKFLKSILNG